MEWKQMTGNTKPQNLRLPFNQSLHYKSAPLEMYYCHEPHFS